MYSILVSKIETIIYLIQTSTDLNIKDSLNKYTVHDFIEKSDKRDLIKQEMKKINEMKGIEKFSKNLKELEKIEKIKKLVEIEEIEKNNFISLNKKISFQIDEKYEENIFKKLIGEDYKNIFKNYSIVKKFNK
jgi:hypothetical protein